MADGTHDAIFHAFLVASHGTQEGGLVVAVPRAAQTVAHFVAKGGDAGHLLNVGLHAEFLLRIGARTGTPAFTIDEDVGRHCLANGIHRLDVVHAHQVEAESVDVILVDPILHALDHELAHERLLTGGLVAAARAVAVTAVGILAVKVVGHGALEVAAVDVEGVVIHHIQYHLDAGTVQRLHHLLELVDAHFGFGGVGRVAAFGHIVVHRVVAPVVLRGVETRLIDRGVVERWQDVHSVHAQFLEVANGPLLGECHELARVVAAHALDVQLRVKVDVACCREVAVVQLIDDEVFGGNVGSLVGAPASGIGALHVDDGATLAVHSHSLGPDAWSLAVEFAVHFHLKGVELAFQVALDGGMPRGLVLGGRHLDGFGSFSANAFVVDAQRHRLGVAEGGESECGGLRGVGHLVARLGVGR